MIWKRPPTEAALLGFRGTLTEIAVKVAAIAGLDNLKAFGNAIHMCVPSVRLRKQGCAGFSAIRTPKIFNPVVEDDHPSNMSLRRDGSSQLSCHNQTDPLPSFVGRCPVWVQKQTSSIEGSMSASPSASDTVLHGAGDATAVSSPFPAHASTPGDDFLGRRRGVFGQ